MVIPDAHLASWGTAIGIAELLPECIGQAVLVKLNMKVNCASLVRDRFEKYWNTIMMIEPTPHLVESTCQRPRINM